MTRSDFSSAQTITLTSGTLTVPANTTITGATSGSGYSLTNLVTVSGGSHYIVFTVNSGVTGAAINNLNVTNGNGGTTGNGGIQNSGSLTVTGSSFLGLVGQVVDSSGIHNTGTMVLTGSTITGNFGYPNLGSFYGGGIYNTGAITIANCTITNNLAANGSAGSSATSYGGGIYSTGTLTVTNSTITGNYVYGGVEGGNGVGGGIDVAGGTATINNSIVSGNTGSVSTNINGTYSGTGNIVGGSPQLGAQGNYGGPTQTVLPLPGSSAICGALAANIPSGVTTDQRGFPNTNTTYPGYSPGTPCVDAGAVQTNYALNFTAQQPSNVAPGVAMTPAPIVTVNESGNPLKAGSASVNVTDTASDLTTSPATASTSATNGQASFSSLLLHFLPPQGTSSRRPWR